MLGLSIGGGGGGRGGGSRGTTSMMVWAGAAALRHRSVDSLGDPESMACIGCSRPRSSLGVSTRRKPRDVGGGDRGQGWPGDVALWTGNAVRPKRARRCMLLRRRDHEGIHRLGYLSVSLHVCDIPEQCLLYTFQGQGYCIGNTKIAGSHCC